TIGNRLDFISLPPPALRECCHGGLACRGIAVGGCAAITPADFNALRRGDRIATGFAAVHESAYGTKRRFGNVPFCARFGGEGDIGRRHGVKYKQTWPSLNDVAL